MNRRTHVQLGVAVIGIIVWGYGVRVDDSPLRLIGIGALAIALLLRFLR